MGRLACRWFDQYFLLEMLIFCNYREEMSIIVYDDCRIVPIKRCLRWKEYKFFIEISYWFSYFSRNV